ncbi:MAG TPA: hypothetical protein DEQ34_02645 [Balneolaceae bacterium]|nr:hypothetical protein [Balneolaceae bacterium]|tara:strand:- start:188496 stop:189938 length:1443 start_codon:yes stop_codon:yes gene_type:complete
MVTEDLIIEEGQREETSSLLNGKKTAKKFKDFERPTPIDKASDFKYEEFFFSITDKKSRIAFGNDVFIRLSKYDISEISGQLHKIIRHPDMPRSVFKLFWDYLKNDKPVVAYVKNLAKDGSYYWVIALAIPTATGYQSIRLKPGSPLFAKVQQIYDKTLRYEKNMEQQMDKQQAMEASEKYMLGLLKEEGFENYDAFMLHALQVEMANRQSNLKGCSYTVEACNAKNAPTSLIRILKHLTTLFQSLADLNRIQDALNEHSDYILNLAHSILLLSLNAQIGSTKLDKKDISLSVVAEKMGEQSMMGEQQLLTMKDSINELHELGSKLNFRIIYTKLRIEMALMFYKEIENGEADYHGFEYSAEQTIDQLVLSFQPRLKKIIKGIGELPGYLLDVITGVQDIEKFLMVLRFIHITGKVEIARMNDNSSSFSTTFNDLIQEIETAEVHLKKLSDVVMSNKDIANVYANISEQLAQLFEELVRG